MEHKILVTIGAKITEFEQGVNKVKKETSSLGNKLTGVGKSLSMGITAPLLAVGVASGKLSMDFGTSMAKVSTIADETKVPMSELKKSILQMANESGESADNLSEALYETISSSVDTADAIGFLGSAQKTAKAGFTDTLTAVDGLTTVLNSYGLKAKETDKIANQMLITQNLGKTTFGELASSIGGVTPIAAALGVKTNELFSSLASTTSQGLSTSESITALKGAMTSIIKPSERAKELAASIGLEFSASAVKSKGWGNFLADVKTKLSNVAPEYTKLIDAHSKTVNQMKTLESQGKKNTEAYKSLNAASKEQEKSLETMASATDSPLAAYGELFGSVEGLNAVLMLGSETGSKIYNDAMKEMSTNTTAVDDAVKKMNKTTGTDFNKAMNSLKTSGIVLGDSLAPSIELVSKGIYNLSTAFQNLSPGTRTALVVIGGLIAIIPPILIGVGMLITSFGVVTGAIATMGGGTAILTGIMGGLSTGISFLTGGLIPMSASTTMATGVLNVFKNMGTSTLGAFKTFGTFLKGFPGMALNGLKSGLSLVTTGVKLLGSNLLGIGVKAVRGFGMAITFLTSPIGLVVLAVVGLIAIGVLLYKNWDTVKANVTGAINSMKSGFTSFGNAAKTTFNNAWNSISGTVTKIKNSINNLKLKFPSISIPHIKLPHFSISGKFSLAPPSMPKMNVKWYHNGGIFTRPTVMGGVGVGDAINGSGSGPEAVLPLKKLPELLGLDDNQNNTTINLNGNYSFRDKDDMDYLLNKLGQIVKRRV